VPEVKDMSNIIIGEGFIYQVPGHLSTKRGVRIKPLNEPFASYNVLAPVLIFEGMLLTEIAKIKSVQSIELTNEERVKAIPYLV